MVNSLVEILCKANCFKLFLLLAMAILAVQTIGLLRSKFANVPCCLLFAALGAQIGVWMVTFLCLETETTTVALL